MIAGTGKIWYIKNLGGKNLWKKVADKQNIKLSEMSTNFYCEAQKGVWAG